MTLYPESFVDDVRGRLALSQVIGREVDWDRSKSLPNKGIFWGCCPFHSEKTSSFKVDDVRGFYHCFGCKASGDGFKWVQERKALSFPEAVEFLAREVGLTPPAPTPAEQKREQLRRSLYEINAAAAAWFAGQLRSEQGDVARAYLEKRRIPESQWADFGLGYAPVSRDALSKHLASLSFAEEAIVASGVAKDGNTPPFTPRDFFQGRLMFPVRDVQGRVCGFGGRIIGEGEPKYLNTGETPAFRKGRLLYNLDRACEPARDAGDLIICEGYLDVAAFERAEIMVATAPLGTAVTADQLALAWRYADEPCLCLDGDAAGQKAMARVLDAALPLLAPGKSLTFVTLPKGKDPDEVMAQKGGAEALAAALEARETLADVLWREVRHTRDGKGKLKPVDVSTPERRAKFKDRITEAVGRIAHAEVRKQYENELAHRLKAFEKEIGVKFDRLKFTRAEAAEGVGTDGGPSPKDKGGGLDTWGPDLCDRMNSRYGVVISGQRTVVLTDHPDMLGSVYERVRFLNIDAYHQWLSNRRVWWGKSTVTAAEAWLRDPARRQYRGLEFVPASPGEEVGSRGFYNLWRGFVVEPRQNPALAEPWLRHVREVVANHNKEIGHWLISWFAWLVQRPRERSGVSPVLRGGMGTGKTMTGAIVGALFPANYFLIDDARYLTGQFNSHLASCLMLHADEAFWAGDKQAEGRLKGLVTAKFQMIEYKGVDPVRMPNYVNLFVTSNDDWVVPAGYRERRFAVIDVSAEKQQDLDYFAKLDAHFRADEAKAALLYELLHWPIDEAALRKIPVTEALFSQKVRSFDSFTGWLYEVLLDGAFTPGGAWPVYVETHDLHNHFLRRGERLGHRYPLSADGFGRKLRSLIPSCQRRQNAKRKWCYLLPSLDACRADFAHAVDFDVAWDGDGPLEQALQDLGIRDELPELPP